jgi:alanyl-tRNA synthetase
MISDELRKKFLDYFTKRGHTVVPSSSLVPEGDPTLLFNIAGMVQFKQFYASAKNIPFTRAVSIQKCLRATDLEEVGRTVKHHTFFEMLGNFSFGDYFKEDAILWAWEFLREVLNVPEGRLYVTVYKDDAETEKIWTEKIGLAKDRIFHLGKDDNFWGPAGLTGACGPCSEIHFDLGREVGCGRPDCSPACSCDRFVEIWNLVFPEFYREEDGSLRTLERRGVDTGMGLERLAMVCQGASSTYGTDLLKPIADFVRRDADLGSRDESHEISVRVISDHVRALCFAISEGVLPSNEGRGYVVRRILRRAVVKALDLGIEEAFLYKVAGRVIDVMHPAYPELMERKEKIAIIIKSDEERFQRTLARGMAIFKGTIDSLSAKKQRVVAGETVFKLYDTYGFPVEITRELAETQGFEIDLEGFETAMEVQRERARQASRIGTEPGVEAGADRAPENFVGYDSLEVPTVITSIETESGRVSTVEKGGEAEIELERTPFYPEGGGQVGDIGLIVGNRGKCTVSDVRWLGGSRISHRVIVDSGTLNRGDGVVAKVDAERRKATQRNHTATHLMHTALRSVLGGHVRQSGSLVAPDRLRFDFTHYEPMSEEELRAVEDIVNSKILSNIIVKISVEAFEDAKAKGAIALFGEKYGQDVRVVEIEATSCELCGGTHVSSTGEIGSLRVVSESGIAAGVRRIEAVTGQVAIDLGRDAAKELENLSSILRVPIRDLGDGARKIMDRVRDLDGEVSGLRQNLAEIEVKELIGRVRDVNGVRVVASRVDVPDVELLKHLADRIGEEIGGIVCVGSVAGDRAVLVVSVDPSIAKSRGVKASAIAKKLGEMVGGRGGGKDTFAQAGGKDVENLDAAIESCTGVVSGLVR